MEKKLTDSSSGTEAEEQADDHCHERKLFQPKNSVKTKKRQSLLCSWVTVKKLVITSYLLVVYFLCNVAFSTISPFFPKEGEAKGVSPAAIGVITGISPLCIVIVSPIVGYLLPRIGFSLPILFGLLQVGTVYVLLGFVNFLPSAWAFTLTSLLLRIIEGIGTAFFTTAAFSITPVFFPSYVGTIVGCFELAAGLGYAIGFPVGAALYEAGGFKAPFILIGSAILLLCVPCTLLVRKIKMEKSESLSINTTLLIFTDMTVITLKSLTDHETFLTGNHNNLNQIQKWPIVIVSSHRIFKEAIIKILAIIMACVSYAFRYPILQPFLWEQFHFGTIIVALTFLIPSLTYMIVNFIVGPLVDKLGYHRGFILFGLTLGGSATFVMGVAYASGTVSSHILFICLIFNGAASAIAIVPVYGDILKTTKKYLKQQESKEALVSIVSGMVISAYFFGEFFGSSIGGTINSFLTFPITAVVVGEIIFAQ